MRKIRNYILASLPKPKKPLKPKKIDAIHYEFRGFHFVLKDNNKWDVYDHDPFANDFHEQPIAYYYKTLKDAASWVNQHLYFKKRGMTAAFSESVASNTGDEYAV